MGARKGMWMEGRRVRAGQMFGVGARGAPGLSPVVTESARTRGGILLAGRGGREARTGAHEHTEESQLSHATMCYV